ncbi:MAG: type II secretion system F family protein, partial [Candidatus Margulisbacteria bacterium]|nr:type II secretion system F family protein [Candidatus Margulisiibacteriota bacterium]
INLQKTLFSFFWQKELVNNILFQIKNGLTLSKALKKEAALDSTLLHILHSAEHSNNLGPALDKISYLVEKDINKRIQTFLKWLEPATTIILSLLVTLILLGLFYPLTKILSSLG